MVGVEPVADLDALAAALRERLLTESASEGPADVEGRIRALVEREAALLDAGAREALVARVAERSFGLGPLEPLLRDPAVDEVMVNGVGPVWIERAGRLERTDVRFASAADLRDAIERILAPLGRRVDEAEPLCDARLPDGSRVNVVIAPLAPDGPDPHRAPLSRARDERRRPRRRRDVGAAAARPAGPRGARAPEHPRQRRDRLGQDDDAQRAVVVRAGRRADRDRSRTRSSCACASPTSCASRRGRRASRAAAR